MFVCVYVCVCVCVCVVCVVCVICVCFPHFLKYALIMGLNKDTCELIFFQTWNDARHEYSVQNDSSLNSFDLQSISHGWYFYNFSVVKLHEATQMFIMVG